MCRKPSIPTFCSRLATSLQSQGIHLFWERIVASLTSSPVLFVEHAFANTDFHSMQVMAKLNKLPGVKAIPRDERLKEKHAHSRIWNETWLSAFFHKPCNHELFVLQSLNMEGNCPLTVSSRLACKVNCQDVQDGDVHDLRIQNPRACEFRVTS